MSKRSQNTIQTTFVRMRRSLEAALVQYRACEAHFNMSAKEVELEIYAEEVRQRELANMIALLANLDDCPYPESTIRERIVELADLDR